MARTKTNNQPKATAASALASAERRAKGILRKPMNGDRLRQRLRIVRELVFNGLPTYAVIDECVKLWGVTQRTVESYISQVRQETKRTFEEECRTGEIVTEIIGRNRAIYAKAMANKQMSAAQRATEHLHELSGTKAAARIELTGKDGGPLESTVANIDVRDLEDDADFEAFGRFLERLAGKKA